MEIITETKRLYLREFLLDDAIHFYTMNLDNEVIKYTGDVAFKSKNEAFTFISNYDQYERYKMGRWAVCLKKTNEFLGWCGLKYHPKKNIVEVGYRFYKKYWNKQYATESVNAAIDYGFYHLNLKTIYAHINIDNLASQRVAEKCDLTFVKEENYEDMPIKLYKIENKNILIKTITAQETHIIRHPVLRAGRPIKDCVFDGDDLETTIHLGLFLKEKLIGVATFLKNNSPLFKEDVQYQLRGMAILKADQKKGFGHLLLKEGEIVLHKKKADRLWFNAREIATNFYKKNNYHEVGKSFKIPKVGIHYTMTKKLS